MQDKPNNKNYCPIPRIHEKALLFLLLNDFMANNVLNEKCGNLRPSDLLNIKIGFMPHK